MVSKLAQVLVIAIAIHPAFAQGSNFEQQRAKLRADFERMRSEHRSRLSPSGQAFVRRMDESAKSRQYAAEQEKRKQIESARSMKVTPSQCALSFNQAVGSARKFANIEQYFSKHYLTTYVHRDGKPGDELAAMKRAYMYDCRVRGKDKIESNGEANVWLEGFEANHKKGIWVNLRMIPENNYWRIDGYKSQTGLNVITIPKL